MNLIKAFILILLFGVVLIPFLKRRGLRIVLVPVLLALAGISGTLAWQALTGDALEWILPGNVVTGEIPLRMDALSAWFILIINFVFLTGGFYGLYGPTPTLPSGEGAKSNHGQNSPPVEGSGEALHFISFLVLYASLISLCVIQNSLVFLIAWEIMTLSAFLTIIFEHEKWVTIKAGINFLIQSHVSVLFLMGGFIWAAVKTGSYDFQSLGQLGQLGQSINNPHQSVSFVILLLFMVGFGIKAGFVPFHTWLPYAHPAAPAHISGIMSGVIIKIGIFGILRMLLLIPTNFTTVGYLFLFISLISGLYGVMLAIVQHNLKKLLAYHSIENIGIIGIGIGIGCIGLGSGNQLLASLGFAGALLHTLNHALFKSLLFYTAGNVYQATHTLHIEHLGGIMKKMPQTAMLFLIAAIAICGIPPFNGFISEFLIYIGLYNWLQHATLVSLVVIVFSIVGLVLIGGLALFCFIKAFGIVFLGNPRQEFHHPVKEVPFTQLAPLYLIAFFIVLIGSFPQVFLHHLSRPVELFTGAPEAGAPPVFENVSAIMQPVAWAAWGVILLTLVLWGIRKISFTQRRKGRKGKNEIKSPISNIQYPLINHKSEIRNQKSEISGSGNSVDLNFSQGTLRSPRERKKKIPFASFASLRDTSDLIKTPTWSCGYVAPTPKLQYTAGSFVRSYTKLFKGILIFSKKEKEIEEIFPTGGHYESHTYDKIEKYLIDKPLEAYQWLMGRFLFLQNGKLQVYILYGIIFILSVICLPLLFTKFADLLEFLKQL